MAKKRLNLEINEAKKHESPIEMEEVIDPITKTTGEVNTIRLNVRANPSKVSSVVRVIGEGDKVNIDLSKSTDDFYAIDDGFVMRQFITV